MIILRRIMKKLVSVVLSLIILAACTEKQENILNYEVRIINGIANIINDNTPSVSVEELNINLKKVLEINGTDSVNDHFRSASYFTVDDNGNIYIFDESDLKISKFDKNGKFQFDFGGSGTGPGEFQGVMGMGCLKDTMFVIDTPVKKFNRFSTDGKFINSSIIPAFISLYNDIFCKNGLLWISRLSFKRSEGGVEFHKIIESRESSLKRVAVFDSSSTDYPPKDLKGELLITKTAAVIDSIMYIANKGDFFDYRIEVRDPQNNLKRVIRKKYARLKVTDPEKDAVKEKYTLLNDPDMSNEDIAERINSYDYKPAIRWIYTDKNDRLWVEESRTIEDPDDTRMKFSIFENGVYLNSILLNFGTNSNLSFYDVLSAGSIRFIGEKIYVLDKNENRLSVYEY